ncbi:hypothetical protein ACFQHN_20090 [Natrialbaceae archaeon GCM10025896]
MCRRAPDSYELGQAADKTRKLINVRVIVDDEGAIHDILNGEDPYIRPQPTITASGALEELSFKLRGD